MRRRAALLVGLTLAASAASYLVIPFLPIVLVRFGGFDAVGVGWLLACWFALSYGMAAPAGGLADRVGARPAMLAGLAASAAGYAAMGVALTPWTLVAGIVLSGLGTALFVPSSKTLLVDQAGAGGPAELFAWRNLAFNVGTALGAAGATAIALRLSLRAPFGVAAACCAVAVLAALAVPPRGRVAGDRPPARDLAGALAGDRALLGVMVCAALFFVLEMQLNVTVPLQLAAMGREALSGLVFSGGALVVIAAQLPVVRAARRLGAGPRDALLGGMLLTSAGLASVAAWERSSGFTVAFVVLFSLGEAMVAPALDTLASAGPPALRSTYLGLVTLAIALGGGAGSVVGGYGFQLARSAGAGPAWWAAIAAAGLLATLVCSAALRPAHAAGPVRQPVGRR